MAARISPDRPSTSREMEEGVLETCDRPHELSDEEILERVLALNLERAAGEERTSLRLSRGGV
jgi:hypothetical protein